jgi:hypothetical protein
MINSKWLLGIGASLIVVGVTGAVATTIKTESRVSKMEAKEEAAAETRRQVREDVREIRTDIKDILRSQAELHALILNSKGK